MAVNSLKIRFFLDAIENTSIAIKFKNTNTNFETPAEVYIWKNTVTQPKEVALTTNDPSFIGKESAINFKNAFLLEHTTGFTATIQSYATETFLTINSLDPVLKIIAVSSSYDSSTPYVDFEEIRNSSELILISGITRDNYYLNNEIWLNINSAVIVDNYELIATNLGNGEQSKKITLYTYNNKSKVNLQSVFKYLANGNQNKYKINIKSFLNGDLIASADFVRNIIYGGKRTNETNISVFVGAILRPCESLPIWNGYPTTEYYLAADQTIKTRDAEVVDYRRENTCNGLYFRFLNQQGGYSNWLFQSYQQQESNKSLGTYSKNNTIEDLGNESNCALSVYGKVPAEYYGIIQDLIISPEIYIWKDLKWVRVFSGRNSTESDLNKKSYAVKLKFDFENRFNPTPLWSN